MRALFTSILTFDLLAVAAAIVIALMLGEAPDRFMAEGKPITWLSTLQLVLIGGVSLAIFQHRSHQLNRKRDILHHPAVVWLLFGIGFILLGIDDLSQFHENLDHWIHKWFNIQETALTDKLDDAIIGLYGLTGLAMMIRFRTELTSLKRFLPQLIIAFGLMALMVGIDMGSNCNLSENFQECSTMVPWANGDYHTIKQFLRWGNAVEDGLKILSEGVFLGLFCSVLAYLKQHTPNLTLVRTVNPPVNAIPPEREAVGRR